MQKNVVLIGNGSFAANCLRLMLDRSETDVKLVISDPRSLSMRGLVKRFCADNDLRHTESDNINAPVMVQRVAELRPHLLISAYNMQIIREELLRTASCLALNFHNGPLPEYRGVNVFSWAIANGETEYGVAWHVVDVGIDNGAVLGQRMFPLRDSDTPVSLMRKSFQAGVSLFDEILSPLLAGTYTTERQDEAHANYYSRSDVPNGGQLDLRWPTEKILRFVRAFDYRPLESPIGHPTLSYRQTPFFVQSAEAVNAGSDFAVGHVVGIEERGIHVQTGDGVVCFGDLLDEARDTTTAPQIATSLGIRPGRSLDT